RFHRDLRRRQQPRDRVGGVPAIAGVGGEIDPETVRRGALAVVLDGIDCFGVERPRRRHPLAPVGEFAENGRDRGAHRGGHDLPGVVPPDHGLLVGDRTPRLAPDLRRWASPPRTLAGGPLALQPPADRRVYSRRGAWSNLRAWRLAMRLRRTI